MAKTIFEWYNNLPASKQKDARQFVFTVMAKSTFYKVLKAEFEPAPDRCQKLANYAGTALKFPTQIYKPDEAIH